MHTREDSRAPTGHQLSNFDWVLSFVGRNNRNEIVGTPGREIGIPCGPCYQGRGGQAPDRLHYNVATWH